MTLPIFSFSVSSVSPWCIPSLCVFREFAMSIFRRLRYPLLLGLIVGSISGCCEWSCKKPQWLYGKDEPRTPVKVVAMWKDTILYRADQPQPVRGFGGRLMFYGEKSEKPVKVEGTLTVYAFDETHSKKEDPRPTRKYVFTAEQFALHYSKSDIGHSYSVWLPWDAEEARGTGRRRTMPAIAPRPRRLDPRGRAAANQRHAENRQSGAPGLCRGRSAGSAGFHSAGRHAVAGPPLGHHPRPAAIADV